MLGSGVYVYNTCTAVKILIAGELNSTCKCGCLGGGGGGGGHGGLVQPDPILNFFFSRGTSGYTTQTSYTSMSRD